MKSVWLHPTHLRFLILALLQGITSASVLPILSTHLALNLHIEPIGIGIFFAANTISGLMISSWFAHRSDLHMSRIRIMKIAILFAAVGVTGIGHIHHYLLLIPAGMLWSGMSATIMPQLFATARENVTDSHAVFFQSLMRAAFAFSWVVIPPVAFMLFRKVGFENMMWLTALMFATMYLLLPADKKQSRTNHPSVNVSIKEPHIFALFVIFTIINMANSMYIVYMPLHVLNSLHLQSFAPGLLMGVAAACEIPIMVIAGALATRWRLLSPIKLALLAGAVFYLGLLFSHNVIMLIALQICNAGFIGLSAGLGMSIFQTLMPGRVGMATTLLGNAYRTGSLIGAAIGGVIAQFGGYRLVFLFSGCCICAALLLVRWADRQIRLKSAL